MGREAESGGTGPERGQHQLRERSAPGRRQRAARSKYIIMETKKNVPFNYIAGGFFAFLALMQLANFHFSVVSVLWLAGDVLLAAALFLKRRDILLSAGFILLALLTLYGFFRGFFPPYIDYRVESWSDGLRFNLLCVLPALVDLAGYAGAAFLTLALTDVLAQYKESAKKLWFVPAACILGSFAAAIVVQLLIRLTGGGYWPASGLSFGNLFRRLLAAGGIGLAGLWLAYPEGMPSKIRTAGTLSANYGTGAGPAAGSSAGGASSASRPTPAAPAGDGYIGMAQHVLLLLLTCGIWLYVWIYRTTGYLNRLEDEEPQNPTTKLLLCMFVPFYFIYWMYKNAQRLDKLAAQNGVASDLTTLCLILAIFVPIIPPILMQDKINAIAAGGGTPSTAGTAQQQPSRPAPSRPAAAGIGAAEELKAYKELLDSGAITQEEFDAKKRQILGL